MNHLAKKLSKIILLAFLPLIALTLLSTPSAQAAIPINTVASSAIKTDSATISWDSTSAGTSAIEYGTTTAYGSQTAEDSLAYFHVQSIAGLAAGTLYHYRIRSKDIYGAETISADYTFTTRTQAQLDAVIKAARADGQLPKTYYVSPTGNDANNGLSTTTPWKTLSYTGDRVDAGDTVYLMSGTWTNDIFTFAKGGIDVVPITLTKYPGATPVLDGSGLGGSSSQVYSAYNYVVIDGLEVRKGIYGIITDGSNSVISNNNIHDTRSHCALLGNPRDSAINNIMNNCGDAAHTDNGLQILAGYATVKGNTLSNVWYHNTIDMFGTFSYVTIDSNTFSLNGDAYIANPHNDPDVQKYITIKNNKFNAHTEGNEGVKLTDTTSEALFYNNTFTGVRPVNTVAVTIEANSKNIIFLKNKLYNSDAIEPLVGSGYYFLDNFVNSDSDPIVLDGVSGTFGYTDGTVFTLSYSGCSVTSALQYSSTGSAIGLSGACSLVPTTYAFTATPSANTATVSVASFNTSLPPGSILANFAASSTNGTNVTFTMSTLKAGVNYLIKKGGTTYTTVQADSTGRITFSNSAWPSSNFTVEETTGGAPIVSDPAFSPTPGTYSSTQSVSISSATSGATIYYTTDNSNPTTSSSIYSSPITVSSTTTTVKALAVKSGYTNSSITTGTYTIAIPVLTSITISPTTASISTGSTQTFTATPKDQFNNTMTGITISWTSSNTSIATVNSSGLVTGISQGTSTITASSGGISSTSSLTVTNQPSGLIAYWKFDETSGITASDSSANANNLSLTNSPVWTAGKVNNALTFNGTNQSVTKSAAAGIPSSAPFTISFWLNAKSFSNSNWNDIFRNTNSWAIQVDPTGKLSLEITNKQDIISITTLPLNTWIHIAVTFSSGTVNYYKDGVLADTQTTSNTPNAGSGAVYLGGYPSWSTYLNGSLDEVRIYNKILTLSEIQSDMNSGTSSSDVTLPTISISSPANNATFSSPSLTVSGTASDNVALSKVEVKLNSGSYQTATGTSSWSLPLILVSGANTILARATDSSNNIKETTITVTYTPPATGTISGTVSNSSNIPIQGATVSTGANSTITDANGSYTLPNMPAGSCVLTASKTGYSSQSKPATVTAGQTTTVNFTLTTPTSTADINSDGIVNSVDFGILMSYWGNATKPKADINQDGTVNSVDFGIMMSAWTE